MRAFLLAVTLAAGAWSGRLPVVLAAVGRSPQPRSGMRSASRWIASMGLRTAWQCHSRSQAKPYAYTLWICRVSPVHPRHPGAAVAWRHD